MDTVMTLLLREVYRAMLPMPQEEGKANQQQHQLILMAAVVEEATYTVLMDQTQARFLVVSTQGFQRLM
jgi:hypothetical protein